MAAAAAVPGLIVAPGDDPFGDLDLSRETAENLNATFVVLPGKSHYWFHTAERLNATFVVLPGKSHYWFHQDPEAAAALLKEFWSQAA